MTTIYHYLTIARKRSRLTQKDIAYFLDLTDPSSVSRWEAGEREIPFEALLLYHILFDVDIDNHLTKKKEMMKDTIKRYIPNLLNEVSQSEPNTRNQRRVQFLSKILTSL